jgi:hypothetical protein
MASPTGAGSVEREWEGVLRNWPDAARAYRALARAVIGEMHDIVSDMVVETDAAYQRPTEDNAPIDGRQRFAFQQQ